jgi:hypothetical protein
VLVKLILKRSILLSSTGQYLEYTLFIPLRKLPKEQNLRAREWLKRPVSLFDRTFSRINRTVLGINRTVFYTRRESFDTAADALA